MWLLVALITGLFVGLIAKLLMPGRDPGGFVLTALLGIAGAMIAGGMGRALGWYDQNQGAGFIASVLGAIILLLLYRTFNPRRTA